jgi:hypothetical protein
MQAPITAGSYKLYYAAGRFDMSGMLSVSAKGDSRCECPDESHLEFIWIFRDKYDWHKNLSARIMGIKIPDSYALELEQCEKAAGKKEYPKPFDTSFVFTEDGGCKKCEK